ncbi:MAG: MFS transporter [Rhodospirillaceae bacterium]
MTDLSARLSIGFSYLGHTVMHVLTALYLTVVLALVPAWHLGYDELIRVWTLGSLMIGLGAPLAGWLGDRWSDTRMMVVFFWLTGGGSIAAGLADEPFSLMLALAALGLGGSIYHPVGMSWLIKNSASRGTALGIQGLFGSAGVASAALVAGTLTDLISWRAAFIIPGALSVAAGIALAACHTFGLVTDRKADLTPLPRTSRSDAVRAFIVLSLTMTAGGLMWNAVMVAMPKWFHDGLGDLMGGSTFGVGGLVTVIYLAGALPQLWGGRLADRFQGRSLYSFCLLLQVPMALLASAALGAPMLVLALVMVSCQNLQIPIENLLLARFTPGRYRGLAYGAKFILTFGVGPLAVQLAAASYRWTGTFQGLFLVVAALAAIAFLASLMLPAERDEEAGLTAPAAD